jgi:COP9 signalosome complex subunit 1
LVAVISDARLEMQQNALEMANRYTREATERLRRVNLISAGLEVQTPKTGGPDEAWFEPEEGLSAGAT